MTTAHNISDFNIRTLDYYSTDTEENANQQAMWVTDPRNKDIITYNIWKDNHYELRTRHHPNELDRDSNITIGCSCTLGVGVKDIYTWPSVLEELTGRKTYNLGVSGGSLDTCFRVLNRYLPITQSKYVYMQCPSVYRRDVGGNLLSHWNVAKIGHNNSEDDVVENFSADWLFTIDELMVSKTKNLYAIQALCDRYDTELRLFRSDDKYESTKHWRKIKSDPIARDGQHPGITWHNEMALFLEDIPASKDRLYTYAELTPIDANWTYR